MTFINQINRVLTEVKVNAKLISINRCDNDGFFTNIVGLEER